jgi:hypothetical protein
MAYQGGIDFLDLPLGGVDWSKDVIYSPWIQDPTEAHTTDQVGSIDLNSVARGFDLQGAKSGEFMIVYDIPRTEGASMKCIVMGRRRESGKLEDARHYVLLVAPKAGFYERIGVGFMPGNFIELNDQAKMVKVR